MNGARLTASVMIRVFCYLDNLPIPKKRLVVARTCSRFAFRIAIHLLVEEIDGIGLLLLVVWSTEVVRAVHTHCCRLRLGRAR
jgi:hypothetical protein